jgi:hypothetical protein
MRGIFVLVLVVFALLIPSVNATTYYVDATGGNDNYNGLYPDYQGGSDGPWKTWNKVRGRTYSAGDTIRFRRDEVWNDITYAWTMDDSGEPGNYITIEDYDTGNKPVWDLEKELQGSTWTEETGEGSNIWSTSYTTTVKRVRLDGQDSYPASSASGIDGVDYLWYWGSSRLYIYSAQNPNNEYTNIKATDDSCLAFRFQGCSYVKIRNIEIHGGVRAIDFRNGVGYDESNIIIEYCDIWYFYNGIIADKDAGGTANNVTIQYCDIDTKLNLISKNVPYARRGVYENIKLENECDDWHIHNNNLSNSGHNILAITSQGSPGQGCNNNIVEYNTFDSSESVYSRAFSTDGVDGKCTNNIYRYNIEKNCNVRDQLGGNDNEFYYNLIYGRTENPATDYSDNSEGVYLDLVGSGICDGVKVYNNVFYDIFNEAISISACSNALIKNNIVMDAGQGGDQPNIAVYLKSSAGAGNVISDNEFYDTDTSTVINYKGSKCTPAYADANHPEFSNNINSDPKFINAPNKDFRLQPDSPCIDAGTNVGLTLDFEGNSVPQGSAPEIGAYEYAGAPPSCAGTCRPNPCDTYIDCSPASGTCTSGYCCSGTCNGGASGLVTLYHFDENSDFTAGDSSGNGNDGTIHGASWTNGISGYALEFDGSGDYVDCGEDASLKITTNITVSAWILPNALENSDKFVSNFGYVGGGSSTGYELAMDSATDARFRVRDTSVVYDISSFAGNWTHLVGTNDGSYSRFYVNGVEVDSNPVGNPLAATYGLRIGMHGQSGGGWFNGTIDEVRIYNRALTQEEILELYSNPGGEQIPADLNNDGFVDIADLGIIAANFGKTSGYDPRADVVPNSEIDVFDLVFVASRFT